MKEFFQIWMASAVLLGLLLGAWGAIVFGKRHDDRRMRYKEVKKKEQKLAKEQNR